MGAPASPARARWPDTSQMGAPVHDRGVDDQRIGRALRVLRHRRELRQSDVAIAANVSQSLVSDIERGRLTGVTHGALRRVFAAVDAGYEGTVLWRGPGLDRLLDADHASLVGVAAERLTRLGWNAIVEATYAVYREQGSIDVLGAMESRRAVVSRRSRPAWVRSRRPSASSTRRRVSSASVSPGNGSGGRRAPSEGC